MSSTGENAEKRKRPFSDSSKTEEATTVVVDTYRFLEMHHNALLYADKVFDDGTACIKKADKDEQAESSGRDNESMRNAGKLVKDTARRMASEAKVELEAGLSDKPEFRRRFDLGIERCETIVEKLTGKKLEWSPPNK